MTESVPAAPLATDATDEKALTWFRSLVDATEDVFLRVPAGGVTMTARLKDDLALDSIAVISVFYAIIDAFETDADEEQTAAWQEVGDVITFARELAREGDT